MVYTMSQLKVKTHTTLIHITYKFLYCKCIIYILYNFYVRYIMINKTILRTNVNNKHTRKFKLLKTPGLRLASCIACSSLLYTTSPVYRSYPILESCSSLSVEPIPNTLLR